MKLRSTICFVLLLWLLGACEQQNGQKTGDSVAEVPKTQLELDQEIIGKYLDKNKIKTKTTSSGLFYSVEDKGNGEPIEVGKKVTFHTTGRLLDGGKFYSSYDDGQPLEAIIGQKMLVPGMEEGIQYFNAGGKGTLYLPSDLGYGAEGFGAQIPPNSIIVFDVEVLSVE